MTLWSYVVTNQSGTYHHQVYSSNNGTSWSLDHSWTPTSGAPAYYWGDRRFHGTGDTNQYIAAQILGVWHKTSGSAPLWNQELVQGAGGVPANTWFYSVFAITEDDVWVGGTVGPGGTAAIWHWNGATWSDLSSDLLTIRPDATQCFSVWASGSTDVWFCGEDLDSGQFVAHYNGSVWTDRTPVGTPPGNEVLYSVFGFAPDNVWVCGDVESGPTANVLQWTGSGWTARNDATLNAYGESWHHIGGSSSSDLWLSRYPTNDLAHWDGAAWSIISPSAGPTYGDGGIVYFGPSINDLWLFGYTSSVDGLNISQSAQPPLTAWTDRRVSPGYSNYVLGLFSAAAPEPSPIILDWRQDVLTPVGIPAGTSGSRNALSFDPVTAKTYFHYDHTTWSFNGTSWAVEQSGGGPLTAGGSGSGTFMAYFPTHPSGPRHVFYGGFIIGGGSAKNETWLFNSSTVTWTRVYPAHSPSISPTFFRGDYCMAYDGTRIIVVNFDGTWLYNGIDWSASPITPPNGSNCTEAAMARDESTGNVILFTKNDGFTWRWNATTTTWAQMSPTTSPPIRRYSAMAYCGALGGVVLFGGWDSNYNPLGDMWRWDDTAGEWYRVWHRYELDLNVVGIQQSMVWDSVRERVVMFGLNSMF